MPKYKDGFAWDEAIEDLWDSGDRYPEDLLEYNNSPKGRDDYLREHGLNPDRYKEPEKKQDEECVVTTACVMSRGLPDDCRELETLRHFRDTYVKSLANGESDIAEYYEKAPAIVAAVAAKTDSADIWDTVYLEMVCECVRLIENNQFSEAYVKYKNYVLALYSKYVEII